MGQEREYRQRPGARRAFSRMCLPIVLLFVVGCSGPRMPPPSPRVERGAERVPLIPVRPDPGARPRSALAAWSAASVNYPVVPPPSDQHWPFAILVAAPAQDPGLHIFREQLETSVALGPRFILVLGDLDTTRDGRFVAAGAPLEFGPDTVPVPLFLFPGSENRPARDVLRLDCFPQASLLCLRRDALVDGSSRRGAVLSEVHAALRQVPDRGTLLLVLDRPAWGDAAGAGWPEIARLLGACRGRVLVVAGNASRYSWWIEAGTEYLDAGQFAAAADGPDERDDGRFSGILWANATPVGVSLSILPTQDVLAPSRFSRSRQQERARLRDSVTATAVKPGQPLTTVSCENPTSQTLRFRTHWEFAQEGVLVEPKILGFELAPGETFRQQFRLSAAAGIVLKLALPTLVLSTATLDSEGRPVPLRVKTSPLCLMRGVLLRLNQPPTLDGWVDEWPGAGNGADHRSQVVRGQAFWHGPKDLSVRFHVGRCGERLFLAGVVQDDRMNSATGAAAVSVVDFYLDPRTVEERADAGMAAVAAGAMLHVRVQADGRFSTSGFPSVPPAVVRVRSHEQGYGVEIALPPGALRPAVLAGPLFMEVAVRDRDEGEGTGTALFYSGGPEGLDTGRHFGEFTIAEDEE